MQTAKQGRGEPVIYWDIEQRSEEWFKIKLAKTSASAFHCVMPGKRGSYLKSRKQYLSAQASEAISQKAEPSFQSPEMLRGIELEPDARAEYELRTGTILYECGFVTHDEFPFLGCSPDGLDGKPKPKKGAEIKCLIGSNHIDEILSIVGGHGITDKYNYQIQFSMACTGLKEWDYILYNPEEKIEKLQFFYTTIKRDDSLINQMIEEAKIFEAEKRQRIAEIQTLLDSIK